jgi:hypothetical protein
MCPYQNILETTFHIRKRIKNLTSPVKKQDQSMITKNEKTSTIKTLLKKNKDTNAKESSPTSNSCVNSSYTSFNIKRFDTSNMQIKGPILIHKYQLV